MPRFWKICGHAFKRPSLAVVARAWAGIEDKPDAPAVSDAEQVRALEDMFGRSAEEGPG
jgi:hypothetical protein